MNEEVRNLEHEDVLEIIKDFPVKPRRNRLIITVNVEEADGELVLNNGKFAESQYILAKSDNIPDLEVGQKVLIDIEKVMMFERVDDNSEERVGVLRLHPVVVNDTIYALISENIVTAIDNR